MKRVLLFFFATMIVGQTWAYDFQDGSVYYKITNSSNHQVEATYPNYSSSNDDYYFSMTKPQGDLTIPQLVGIGQDYTVTGIGVCAFYGCTGLTSITIPNTVTCISNAAFYGCNGLSSFTIPNSVESIGINAFYGCDNLQYNEYENALYLGNDDNPYFALIKAKSTDIISCTINNNCKIIVGKAFQNCASLTTITVPNSVKYIGEGAFNGCSELQSITLPFVGDTPREVYLNNANTNYSGFYDYFSWNTRPLGYIFGTNNYTGSIATEQLYVYDGKLLYQKVGSDTYFDYQETYYIPSSLKEVTITGNNSVPYAAFYNCSMLETINIQNSEIICKKAFYNCSNLKSLNIGTCGVSDIRGYAFESCTSLTSIDIPNTVINIEGQAFRDCRGLTSVTIPNTVLSIGKGAFQDCINLTIYCQAKVKHSNWNEEWNINECPIIWGTRKVNVSVMANDSDLGQVSGTGTYYTGSEAIISATANEGYKFAKWSDGNTTNPRSFTVIGNTNLTAIFESDKPQEPIVDTLYIITQDTIYSIDTIYTIINNYDTLYNTQIDTIYSIDTVYTIINNYDTLYNSQIDTIVISKVYTIYIDTVYSVVNTRDTIYNTRIDTIYSVINKIDTVYSIINKTDTIYNVVCNYDTVYSTRVDTVFGVIGKVDTIYNVINKVDTIYNVINTRDTIYLTTENTKIYTVMAVSANPKMGMAIGTGSYIGGSVAEIVAIEKYGYHFTKWSDGNTDNPRFVNVSGSCSFTAEFEINNYSVLASANEQTMGLVEGSANYAYLSRTQLKAIPNDGYQFKGWSDGETENPRNILVYSDTTFTAVFEIAGTASAVAESAANAINIYAHGRTIVVENATDEIRVYNTMGALVGRDVARNVCTITVNGAGVYIVKTGNVVKRVMVN